MLAQSPTPRTGPKAFDGKPVDQLVEEFDTVTAQQAALVAQLRAWFANERSRSTQKDEEPAVKAHWYMRMPEHSLSSLMHSTLQRRKCTMLVQGLIFSPQSGGPLESRSISYSKLCISSD
ncbi:hypothetical protein Tco_0888301 [Tanacetum coccineum]